MSCLLIRILFEQVWAFGSDDGFFRIDFALLDQFKETVVHQSHAVAFSGLDDGAELERAAVAN